MTTANHPENQNPNGLPDLVQISTSQVRLWESSNFKAIASSFIDRGHTMEDRFNAAQDVRSIVRAYLCR